MKKYLPALLLLFLFNSGALWLLFSLLSARYFVLGVSLLIVLNIGLLFFSELLFIKVLRLRPLLPTDPSDIHKIWHFERNRALKTARCYIAPGPGAFSLHFSNGKANAAVFSESLLELLTKEELKALACYYQTGFATGWSLFFTLLSFFCALLWALFFVLESPFRFFLKDRKPQKSPFCFAMFIKALSFPACRIFLYLDRKTQHRLSDFSLPKALWKTQSLYELEQLKLPDWMVPVFFANPLTKRSLKWYLSFQPKIRLRMKALAGTYPL